MSLRSRRGWFVMTALALIIATYAITLFFLPETRPPFLRGRTDMFGLGVPLHLAGDDVDHRAWMIRSYSLTFAAVMLRIYLPISLAAGVPFDIAYPAIAWLCWVPNVIVCERAFVRASAAAEVAM